MVGWRVVCPECGKRILVASPDALLPRHQMKGGDVCAYIGEPAEVVPDVPQVKVNQAPPAAGPEAKPNPKKAAPSKIAKKDRCGVCKKRRAVVPAKTVGKRFTKARCAVCLKGGPRVRIRIVRGGLPGLGKRS